MLLEEDRRNEIKNIREGYINVRTMREERETGVPQNLLH
jgi:hypothetical protein